MQYGSKGGSTIRLFNTLRNRGLKQVVLWFQMNRMTLKSARI